MGEKQQKNDMTKRYLQLHVTRANKSEKKMSSIPCMDMWMAMILSIT